MYLARKFLQRLKKGDVSARVGGAGGRGAVRGTAARRRGETSVFKSVEQSLPGWSNFEIRAFGSALFYVFF